jgi:hypothetical protein
MADNSHFLEAAIITLSAVAIGAGLSTSAAWAGPIAIFGLAAIAIGFVILLVDDLITLFSGGTSIIGSFLDEIFGIGTATELVHNLTDAWGGLTMAIGEAYDAVTGFFGVDTSTALGGETATTTRGFDPATAISPEENARISLEADKAARANSTAAERRLGLAPTSVTVPSSVVGTSRSTVINSPVTLNVPAGTAAPESERLRRVVGDVLDERNRSAAAAIAEEAEA